LLVFMGVREAARRLRGARTSGDRRNGECHVVGAERELPAVVDQRHRLALHQLVAGIRVRHGDAQLAALEPEPEAE